MSKELVLQYVVENKVVFYFIAYSVLEYYLGKTDKVAEGSVLEFVWAKLKGFLPFPKSEN